MDKRKMIDISLLDLNEGQVEGLPQNPRFIRTARFDKLVRSVEDAPEMMRLRPLIAVEHGGRLVVVAGNMRLRACRQLRWKEVPCCVLPSSTPAVKLREYAIKDNVPFGETDWDLVANEWDTKEVNDWGLETPDQWGAPSRWSGDEPKGTENEGSNLPLELQGVDLTPDDLPKLSGNDETALKRVIIVYPEEAEAELARRLGVERIEKIVYRWEEMSR